MNCPINNSVLIVDDDATFCEMLAKALKRRGYSIHAAKTCSDAIAVATQQTPAYAVVDLRIGIESGLGLIPALIQALPHIRVVILTGYASIATAVEAIKLGAAHYLTKPASADEIIAAFSEHSDLTPVESANKPLSVKQLEWEHVNKILTEHNGNITAAAKTLGLHRRSLQRKLQKRPSKT